MWQLLDIAYVIPATVAIGYAIGKYLESQYEGDFMVNSIMIAAALGLVLSVYKIKRFIDSENKKK